MDLKTDIIAANRHWDRLSPIPPFHRDRFHDFVRDLDHHLMSLIVGPRRVGKSTLLLQILNHLVSQKSVPPRQILFFEFSPRQPSSLVREIYDYFNQTVADADHMRYFLFDEIQFVKDYEIPLKLIYDQDPLAKIFITGSLSLSYKRRMAESLAGRFLPYRIYPLNFSEYLRLSNHPQASEFVSAQTETDQFKKAGQLTRLNAAFRDFLLHGRLPLPKPLSPDSYSSYLDSIISQSLSQDSLSYFSITRSDLIIAIYEYIRSRSGLEISVENIAAALHAPRATASKYLDILEIMGLVYFISNSPHPLIKLNARRKAYVNSAFYLKQPTHDFLTSLGFAAESYILERLLEQNHSVTFYRRRHQEIDFLLPARKLAYEVKFSPRFTSPKNPLPDFKLQILSQAGDHPVCLF